MSNLRTVCPDCGTAFDRTTDDRRAQCYDCLPNAQRTPADEYRGTQLERGYDYRWRVLSRRARELQPFCSDCGSPDDLTADHTPTAWKRREQGKPIRLQDIDVVCRRCNTDRGPARGAHSTRRHRHSALEPTTCPVCSFAIEPTEHRTVSRHHVFGARFGAGAWCPMSGQPWRAVLAYHRPELYPA